MQRTELCIGHEARGLHPRCVAVRCIDSLCVTAQSEEIWAACCFTLCRERSGRWIVLP